MCITFLLLGVFFMFSFALFSPLIVFAKDKKRTGENKRLPFLTSVTTNDREYRLIFKAD